MLILFIGDLLTAKRLKKLHIMRAGDYNSHDRYDFMQPVAGWLHTMMAYSNSLHEQYLGTSAGRGLYHCMTLLKRKGLLGHSPRVLSTMIYESYYYMFFRRIHVSVGNWSSETTT